MSGTIEDTFEKEELQAIHKLLSRMSVNKAMKAGLSFDEADLIYDIYRKLGDYLCQGQ